MVHYFWKYNLFYETLKLDVIEVASMTVNKVENHGCVYFTYFDTFQVYKEKMTRIRLESFSWYILMNFLY